MITTFPPLYCTTTSEQSIHGLISTAAVSYSCMPRTTHCLNIIRQCVSRAPA